jgi:hypothetical protein
MSIFWQQVIIGGMLSLSLGYLVIRYVRRPKAEAGCKSCPALNALSDRDQRTAVE